MSRHSFRLAVGLSAVGTVGGLTLVGARLRRAASALMVVARKLKRMLELRDTRRQLAREMMGKEGPLGEE